MTPVAGLDGAKAFNMSVGYLALGFVGTCLSWILISKFGRRRIYNIGLAVLTVIMFIIGILDCAPDYENRPGIIWAQSALMVRYSRQSVIAWSTYPLLINVVDYLEWSIRHLNWTRLLRSFL